MSLMKENYIAGADIFPLALENLKDALVVENAVYDFPWSRTNFVDCLNSGYDCWMLKAGELHIGHSVLSVGAGEGHLLNITISAGHQRQGLGRYLLRFMLGRASELGAETLFLEVRQSNWIALDLYMSEGFSEVGRRKAYYPGKKAREDALILAAALSF